MTAPLRIGFLSTHNPYDRAAFSGTTYHAARALGRVEGIELTVLGPHREKSGLARKFERFLPDPAAKPGNFDLEGQDAVLGLVASALIDPLLAGTDAPIYHVTDATSGFLAEFYGHDIPAEIHDREARVVQQVARTIYSSDYMATRATAEYRVQPEQVAVAPFGINFDDIPATPPPAPPAPPLRLLYVGTDWTRKGGAIALAAFETLRAAGIEVSLTLVGEPPDAAVPDGVTVAGVLDKNVPAEAARLRALFETSHMFLLPTRADCTPMVVAEANVFGLPVLITDTGGVASLVAPGVNGRLLPMAADGALWAGAVIEMLQDLPRLRVSAHDHAVRHLTWDAWAARVVDIIRKDCQKATQEAT